MPRTHPLIAAAQAWVSTGFSDAADLLNSATIAVIEEARAFSFLLTDHLVFVGSGVIVLALMFYVAYRKAITPR